MCDAPDATGEVDALACGKGLVKNSIVRSASARCEIYRSITAHLALRRSALRLFHGTILGIIVRPWFMNIVIPAAEAALAELLLPADGEEAVRRRDTATSAIDRRNFLHGVLTERHT